MPQSDPTDAPGDTKEAPVEAHGALRRRLADSGLFDADFYTEQYGDVGSAQLDPLDHYIRHGARERRNPNPDFDAAAYLARYPDAGDNPLLHYVEAHAALRQRLADSGLFDEDFYLAQNSDVATAQLDPLDHYIKHGAREGRDPNPTFDTAAYLARHPDAGDNPLLHYLEAQTGLRQRLADSGLFDEDFYLAQNSDVAEARLDPLDHYIEHGAREGRDPNPTFDAAAYLARHPDAGDNPLLHYLETGGERHDAIRRRLAESGIIEDGVKDQPRSGGDPDTTLAARTPSTARPRAAADDSVRRRLADSGLFDAQFYRAQNTDVAAASMDPLDHYIEHGAREGRNPSSAFDAALYLAMHPVAAAENPLLHYLETGHKDSRSGRAVRPTAPRPTEVPWTDWQRLAERLAALPAAEPRVDVIIPVYRGLAETANCLYAAVSSRLTAGTAIEVVAIDDASPEPKLPELLDRLSKLGLFTLLRNPTNVGFVATVNRGMSLHPDRDVVLLNSDTEVYSDWIDRLHAAANLSPTIGTVTPFSNNATICSYPQSCRNFPFEFELPFSEIDRLAGEVNRGRVVDLPTGIGFCLYIRRECLTQEGLFDLENFGEGYGEENDFCCRIAAKGWRNILAADVFVRHLGRTSFGDAAWDRQRHASAVMDRLHPSYFQRVDAFLRHDPVRPLRRRLDIARLRSGSGKRAMMMVSHNIGGGTEKHIQELCARLEAEGIATYLLRPSPLNDSLAEIVHSRVRDIPNIGYIDIKHGLADAAQLLRELGIFHMHIHHLHGYARDARYFFPALCREVGVAYDFTFHDYMSICPRINMIDATGVFCDKGDLAGCEVCIRADGSEFGDVSVGVWRAEYEHLLRGARRLFAPNQDGRLRLQRFMPGFDIAVRPHPETVPVMSGRPLPRGADDILRVAVIGNISLHKGARQLKRCAEDARRRRLPITYVVFGYSELDFSTLPNVEVTGRYRQEDLPLLLAAQPCHLAFIPSVCPESHSYVLSEALSAGLFPVAFDLGAQAQRIRSCGWGRLLPFSWANDASRVNDALLSCEVPAMPDRDLTTGAGLYDDMLADYYQLPREDMTRTATPDSAAVRERAIAAAPGRHDQAEFTAVAFAAPS